jgi:hypothetical protein
MLDFFDRLADELVRAASPTSAAPPLTLTTQRSGRSPRWHRRRRPGAVYALLVLAVAVLAIVVVRAPAGGPARSVVHTTTPAVKTVAVAFRTTESGDIIATVTDPFAAQSTLNAAFEAAGLDITVTLVPVSPSLVGTVISVSQPVDEPDGHIEAIQHGTCIIPANGCPIGITVPRGFTGAGFITLGRPAQPGEIYTSTNSAFAPGEALYCSGLLNEQVATAIPQIQADNITAEWWHQNPTDNFTNDLPPSGNDYIVGAVPVTPGTVLFQTRPTALSAADIAKYAYNQGC